MNTKAKPKTVNDYRMALRSAVEASDGAGATTIGDTLFKWAADQRGTLLLHLGRLISSGSRAGMFPSERSDKQKCLDMYGHPLAAMEFISRDLLKATQGDAEEMSGQVQRTKTIIRMLRSLVITQNEIEYGVMTWTGMVTKTKRLKPEGEPLVPAAQNHTANVQPMEYVMPEVKEPSGDDERLPWIERAYCEIVRRRIQLKNGRWRYHIKGWGRGRRSSERWITRLYEFDKQLREMWTPGIRNIGPSVEQQAHQWHNSVMQPQYAQQRQVEREWFGAIDDRMDEAQRLVWRAKKQAEGKGAVA